MKTKYSIHQAMLRALPAIGLGSIVISSSLMPLALFAGPATLKWSLSVNGWPSGPAVSPDGRIYVTTGSSNPNARKLYCIQDLGDHAIVENSFQPAKTSTFGPLAPTLGPDGIVYDGTQKGSGMKGIFILSGNLASSSFYPLAVDQGGVFNSLALDAQGVVYNASGAGQLVALQPNGALTTLDYSSTAEHVSPVIGRNGRVYFAPTLTTFVEVDPTTRQRTRTWTSGRGEFISTPAIGVDGTVYICAKNVLYALDPATGGQKELLTPELANESARTFGFLYSSPCLGGDGVIYVGNQDRYFYAVDSVQGGVIARFETGAIKASPAIAQDGTVYVGNEGGTFWALRLERGQLVEQGRASGFGSFLDVLAIGKQGTVYITDQDGYVHAFEGTARPAFSSWPMYQQNARHDGLAKIEPLVTQLSVLPGPIATENSAVVFAAIVEGSAPLEFQWCKDGQIIAGATGSQLTLNQVQSADAGEYSIIVANEVGCVTNRVQLTVQGPPKPPTITGFSANQTLSSGQELVLAVQVDGTAPFEFVWTLNHQVIPGATNAVLRIPSVSAANVGVYAVKVSNAASLVPVEVAQPAMVTLTDLRMFAGLVVTGSVGSKYQLQYADALGSPVVWQDWKSVTLQQTVEAFVDTDSSQRSQRFYRAIYQAE
jgi:outer membrane protein assembly factor BamB